MIFCLVNGHPYFTTITGKVNYRTIRQCHGRGRKEILKRIQAIVTRKTKRVLQVNEYHANNSFKKIEADLVSYTIHKQASGENEPTLEWNIRILKDRIRSMVHSVPYRKMPLLITDYKVGQAQSMLNFFSSKTGISTTMSVRNIIKGRKILDYNPMDLKLGAYVQLFEGKKTKQRIRSVGAVALNLSN